VWMGVWSENFGAQRFYARYGFSKVGTYAFPVGKVFDLEFILRRPPTAACAGSCRAAPASPAVVRSIRLMTLFPSAGAPPNGLG